MGNCKPNFVRLETCEMRQNNSREEWNEYVSVEMSNKVDTLIKGIHNGRISWVGTVAAPGGRWVSEVQDRQNARGCVNLPLKRFFYCNLSPPMSFWVGWGGGGPATGFPAVPTYIFQT